MKAQFNAPFLAMLIGLPLWGKSPATPPLPYKDWGICPFECCTYRDWTVSESYKLMKSPEINSTVLNEYPGKGRIRALTGVVITTKPGIIKILAPMEIGERRPIKLKPGMMVYVLPLVSGLIRSECQKSQY